MSTFGTLFRVTTFGESHCASVGAIIDGCPPVRESIINYSISSVSCRDAQHTNPARLDPASCNNLDLVTMA